MATVLPFPRTCSAMVTELLFAQARLDCLSVRVHKRRSPTTSAEEAEWTGLERRIEQLTADVRGEVERLTGVRCDHLAGVIS